MKIAPKPDNELLRVNLLERLEILDTVAENVYDDLTFIASKICNTPIALVSLVDKDRQWFKSRVGLDAEETPRAFAFCAHAILQDNIFEIPDSHKDERFIDNPLVTGGPKVRFYAGAPLVSQEGLALGTICVIDQKPAMLDETQKRCLLGLARQATGHFELRLLVNELRRIDQLKDDFIAKVNHELRTPLTSIQGSISLLNHLQNSPTSSSELLSIAERNVQHLMRLVDELLDIQKLQSGELSIKRKRFEISKLGSRVNELTHNFVVEHDCSLVVEQDFPNGATIDADEGRIVQVITNFVSNAAKFSQKNGKIVVRIQIENDRLKVSVTDNGLGIKPEQQRHLFQKFCQIENVSKTKGTGLGLCISKEIIKNHGGEVFVNSTPGVETVFGFEISEVAYMPIGKVA